MQNLIQNFVWLLPLLIILLWITLMQWFGKLPSINSIQGLATVLNTRGGNILILTFLTVAFSIAGIRLIYWGTMLALSGKIDMKDAILLLPGFGWVTGQLAGGVQGALLKTMTGEDQPVAPAPPAPEPPKPI